MSTSQMSADDFFMSLNGFDEIAISKAFDMEVFQLRKHPFKFLRSLAFVDMRRNGMKDAEAKEGALNLTIDQLQDYFAKPEEEFNEDDPITESGKDGSQPD
jgi:hypothetical protein